jgi:phosphoketolase
LLFHDKSSHKNYTKLFEKFTFNTQDQQSLGVDGYKISGACTSRKDMTKLKDYLSAE